MKIAAVYDIHGNLPALEAVLDEITQNKVDHIVIGGDVVAGPMPVECVDLLQAKSKEIPISFIHGNGESEVLRVAAGKRAAGLSPQADVDALWVANKLRPDQIEFLKTWQLKVALQAGPDTAVLFCHATPWNDTAVFSKQTPDERVKSLIGQINVNIVVCGHTHMQFDRQVGEIRVINSGSVGMSFGQTGAFWLMLDNEITFKRTTYNLQQTADRIKQSDYPEAEEFALNNVLKTPTIEDAMAMISQLESQQQQ